MDEARTKNQLYLWIDPYPDSDPWSIFWSQQVDSNLAKSLRSISRYAYAKQHTIRHNQINLLRNVMKIIDRNTIKLYNRK